MSETPQEPTPAAATHSGSGGAKQVAPVLTEYLVLSKEAGFWKEEQKVKARSSKEAVRQYVTTIKLTEEEATFAAVPARSWQPVTVKTEMATKLILT